MAEQQSPYLTRNQHRRKKLADVDSLGFRDCLGVHDLIARHQRNLVDRVESIE
jgi:hypothetical protein